MQINLISKKIANLRNRDIFTVTHTHTQHKNIGSNVDKIGLPFPELQSMKSVVKDKNIKDSEMVTGRHKSDKNQQT